MNGILTAVEKIDLEKHLRQELSRTLDSQDNPEIPIETLQQRYKVFAEKYLEIKQPFHWNITNPNDGGNFEKDIDQYLELVEFCAFVNDTDMMKKWGINNLLPSGGSYSLAKDIPSYIRALEYSEKEVPDVIKPHIQWLIKNIQEIK